MKGGSRQQKATDVSIGWSRMADVLYHNERPYRVVDKDNCCDHEHREAHETVQLY